MRAISPEALDRVLEAHGAGIDADEFLAILNETVDSTDALSAGERAFLVEHGVAEPDEVDLERQTEALQKIAVGAAKADGTALRDGHTTAEVAEMLGTAAANVRRSVARGDLYVAGRTRNREHVFPAWQFTENGPLPGLRRVLAHIPEDFHPLDIGEFMLTPIGVLGDRSPAERLAHGGEAERVVALADELGRA